MLDRDLFDFLEHTADAAFAVTDGGEICSWNGSAETLFGFARDEGDKSIVCTKEDAGHSLPYLIAVAILDNEVLPPQFAPDRIQRADVQQVLRKFEQLSADRTTADERHAIADAVRNLEAIPVLDLTRLLATVGGSSARPAAGPPGRKESHHQHY